MKRYDLTLKLLIELTVGNSVLIHQLQRKGNQQRSKSGEIVDIHLNRKYCVKCKTKGRITLRNSKYIKPLPTPSSQTIPHPIISTGITPNLTENYEKLEVH